MSALGVHEADPELARAMQRVAVTDASVLTNPPASEAAIAALKPVGARDLAKAGACPVCTESLSLQSDTKTHEESNTDICLKLPCDHAYHAACVVPWLHQHNTCPLCRFELPTDNPEYERRKRDKLRRTAAAQLYRSMFN
mmetsp:Transcript_3609/g.7891  ORF Transcript_3609/g.7891 Transcript_3609/m.7891 type:complete len:140 (-) Transcript_3609:2196-2615(-)